MSRDINRALQDMTGIDPYGSAPPPPLSARGAAPAAKSSALLPGGQSSGGNALDVGPEKLLTSSDGLFTLAFPAVVTMVKDGVTYTLGVIETTP